MKVVKNQVRRILASVRSILILKLTGPHISEITTNKIATIRKFRPRDTKKGHNAIG